MLSVREYGSMVGLCGGINRERLYAKVVSKLNQNPKGCIEQTIRGIMFIVHNCKYNCDRVFMKLEASSMLTDKFSLHNLLILHVRQKFGPAVA